MYNVHPYFSLKNLGKKVHIIHSRIQVSHVPHCRGEQVQGARVDQNLIILERLGRDRRTVRKRSPHTHTHTHALGTTLICVEFRLFYRTLNFSKARTNLCITTEKEISRAVT